MPIIRVPSLGKKSSGAIQSTARFQSVDLAEMNSDQPWSTTRHHNLVLSAFVPRSGHSRHTLSLRAAVFAHHIQFAVISGGEQPRPATSPSCLHRTFCIRSCLRMTRLHHAVLVEAIVLPTTRFLLLAPTGIYRSRLS